MISLIVIVIVIREIHDLVWALMIVIMPKEVAESHRFTITTTFMARPRRRSRLENMQSVITINLDKSRGPTHRSPITSPGLLLVLAGEAGDRGRLAAASPAYCSG